MKVSQTNEWRFGIAHSRMFCMIWNAEPHYAGIQRQKLAYAMALGKPIRLLLTPGNCLPEDLCAGYADFQVARIQRPREVARQIQAWLAALPPLAQAPHA